MFLDKQNQNQLEKYINLLQKIGSLSGLFSDSSTPYLYYRAAENIFCEAFEAENHSRSDTSIDASKNGFGVGLKTFLNKSGSSFQKIAEFNKSRLEYSQFSDNAEKIVETVSRLRNERVGFTQSAHGVNDMIYHCVTRAESKFFLSEEKMKPIKIDSLKVTKVNDNTIHFTDSQEDYNFNLSKSTLLKRFHTAPSHSFDVEILKNPFKYLEDIQIFLPNIVQQHSGQSVILPLYSKLKGSGANYLPEKSGLNMWNAGGRKRSAREVYIPIPRWIHRAFPNFLPPNDQSFNLRLPNGNTLLASVCQQDGKALMSNPNTNLGEWILGTVLKINPEHLVTYDDLVRVGIDSVELIKKDENNFEIDFKALGTFDDFEEENNTYNRISHEL